MATFRKHAKINGGKEERNKGGGRGGGKMTRGEIPASRYEI